MKLRLLSIAILAAFILSLSGCFLPGIGSSKEVSIDISYDGKQLEVPAGERVKISLFTLPPTAGWKLVSIGDQNVVRYESYGPAAAKDKSGEIHCACGTPEEEVWTFIALKRGTTDIHMEYGQLGEGSSKPMATFDLSLVVE